MLEVGYLARVTQNVLFYFNILDLNLTKLSFYFLNRIYYEPIETFTNTVLAATRSRRSNLSFDSVSFDDRHKTYSF